MPGQEVMSSDEVRKLLTGGYVGPRPAKQPIDQLEIELPMPPKAVHPNAREHWAVKAKATKKQREDAAVSAKASLRGRRPPQWERVTIQATFYKPGNRSKVADQDGLISSLKSAVDGLEDSGIVANDRGVTWLPPVQLIGKEAEGDRKCVLIVKPIQEPQP